MGSRFRRLLLVGVAALGVPGGLVLATTGVRGPVQATFADLRRDPAMRSSALAIRHLERTPKGWLVAESANFRIYHKQSKVLAEQVARAAELARDMLHRKWFGSPPDPWYVKCAVYIHPSRRAYAEITGVRGAVGHAQAKMEGDRTFTRTIHLAAGVAMMVEASVPHEVSHLVMNDRFGGRLPRWANEGMAMLAEPDAAQNDRLRQLLEFRRKRALYSLDVLFEAERAEQTDTLEFYAQSFSVTDFLVAAKGPRVFIRFLGDGVRGGYDRALTQHYGIRNFADLEVRWRAHAFDIPMPPAGFVQGTGAINVFGAWGA